MSNEELRKKIRKTKTRLNLKYLRKWINEAVEWNFGYCPSDSPKFDAWIEEEWRWMAIAKVEFPDLYDSHYDIICEE